LSGTKPTTGNLPRSSVLIFSHQLDGERVVRLERFSVDEGFDECDDRITTAGQLEAYVKAVCAGAMARLGAKAGPTQALRAAIIVEDIMSTFMVSGNAVFCRQRFVRNLEK
jgi:hypothetical protein